MSTKYHPTTAFTRRRKKTRLSRRFGRRWCKPKHPFSWQKPDAYPRYPIAFGSHLSRAFFWTQFRDTHCGKGFVRLCGMGSILYWIKHSLLWVPFHIVLKPLIKRNFRLRERGVLPDKWYWADLLALKCGFRVSIHNKPVEKDG